MGTQFPEKKSINIYFLDGCSAVSPCPCAILLNGASKSSLEGSGIRVINSYARVFMSIRTSYLKSLGVRGLVTDKILSPFSSLSTHCLPCFIKGPMEK